MNKKVFVMLALIVLISGAISFSLLTHGQSWLDDFASYLMQAKSILSGTMGEFVRRNAFTVTQSSYPPGPAAYPWGFPLLLAPVYAAFGMNVLAFKLINTLFYGLFLIVFFGLARTRLTDGESLSLMAVLAFNPMLLLAHDQILSDLPFLFFSTLGIFLIDRFTRRKTTPWVGLAAGVCIFAANFTRTNGFLLFIPLALAQLIQLWPQRQDKAGLLIKLKTAFVPYLAFVILLFVQTLIFPGGQESYLSHFSMFSLQGLWANFLYYLQLPAWTFNEIPGGTVLYPLLLTFVVISMANRHSRDLPIYAYALAVLGLFTLWPERQGLRFIYPILPFLFIFAFDGMKLALGWLKGNWQTYAGFALSGFWIVLALASLGVSFTLARDNLAADRAINGPFDPVSAQMFEFVREKTPDESVIIFFKPRAMRLFTDRDAFMTDRCGDLPKGDYLALSEKVGNNGQIPPEEVTQCSSFVKLEKVFNNRRFAIYKISK
jgi:hypothetical protein